MLVLPQQLNQCEGGDRLALHCGHDFLQRFLGRDDYIESLDQAGEGGTRFRDQRQGGTRKLG